ncbi:MAG: diphosphatase, partial [Frankiales bacterium]|nr:diphosphatase [Frankiales bacterium]
MTTRVPVLSRAAVDRAAARRADEGWLAEAAVRHSSKVMVVHDGETLVDLDTDAPAIIWYAGDEAPEGERYFLGEQDDVAYFAVAAELPLREDARRAGLREL